MEYLNATDYFFTDYHWNLQKLNHSVQFANNLKEKLFTGIDIFGRGAYEGG